MLISISVLTGYSLVRMCGEMHSSGSETAAAAMLCAIPVRMLLSAYVCKTLTADVFCATTLDEHVETLYANPAAPKDSLRVYNSHNDCSPHPSCSQVIFVMPHCCESTICAGESSPALHCAKASLVIQEAKNVREQ